MSTFKTFQPLLFDTFKFLLPNSSYTDDYKLKRKNKIKRQSSLNNNRHKNLNQNEKMTLLMKHKEPFSITHVVEKTKDENLVKAIFTNLEKIFFRNRVPGINVMDERTAAAWARDIYINEDDLQGITKKTEDLINISVSVPNIIQSFKYLFTYERGAKGFHRWGNLKYFLFEYEEFLKLKAQETNDKVTLDDFGETTIEHIIPQHFWDNWKEEVNSVTDGLEEEEKIEQTRKVLLNTLGNLTILKNGKNSSLGNRGWKEKKERFRTGSYNEIEISKHDKWTKLNISERGAEMLKFLETKVTGLTFTDDEIKKTLYFDDYITERLEVKVLQATGVFDDSRGDRK